MIRWRYVDFTMMQFRVGTATLADDTPAGTTFVLRVLRFANAATQYGDTHWRVDPIFGMGYPPEVALTFKTAAGAASGNVAWEIGMHSHENGRNISMPYVFNAHPGTVGSAGVKVWMTDFTALMPTGYWLQNDNIWWAIRVQRKTTGDTVADAVDLMNFSLRYRVER